MHSQARPAADGIGMRRKLLFYLSRWLLVPSFGSGQAVGRWPNDPRRM